MRSSLPGRTAGTAVLAMFLGVLFALLAVGFFMLPTGAIGPGPETGRGTFRVLTYNVAGLPLGLSHSNPAEHSKLISPKLNVFDIVLLQEDFSFHDDLISAARHPFQWTTDDKVLPWTKDGLTRLAFGRLSEVERVKWLACHGVSRHHADCLGNKGFSFGTLDVAPGIEVHLYNLHADAGRSDGDIEARADQFGQLAAFILERSPGCPLIVAGDTNLSRRAPADGEILSRFLAGTGLTDVASALAPKDRRVDRVFFRSTQDLRLTPLLHEKPAGFVAPDGAPLSDHEPVGVVFEWALR